MRSAWNAWMLTGCLAMVVGPTWAQPAGPAAAPAGAKPPAAAKVSEHERSDIQRHRAMAAAHEAAARCLEAGRGEAACVKDLQAACKGLGIGKYCGMKHEH